jgi:hypothetical protein
MVSHSVVSLGGTGFPFSLHHASACSANVMASGLGTDDRSRDIEHLPFVGVALRGLRIVVEVVAVTFGKVVERF